MSTLAQDIITDEIASLLQGHGTNIDCKVFETNGKRHDLVQFEEATKALVCKHASLVSGFVTRISFSQVQNI